MKKVLILLFAVVVLLPATGIAKKRDSDLMGTYSVRGYNPGVQTSGTPNYTGTLEIEQSDGAYLLTWRVGNAGNQTYRGVGVYSSGILSAGFTDGKANGGVVSYKVEKGRILKGVWAPWAGGAFGFEIAERQ